MALRLRALPDPEPAPADPLAEAEQRHRLLRARASEAKQHLLALERQLAEGAAKYNADDLQAAIDAAIAGTGAPAIRTIAGQVEEARLALDVADAAQRKFKADVLNPLRRKQRGERTRALMPAYRTAIARLAQTLLMAAEANAAVRELKAQAGRDGADLPDADAPFLGAPTISYSPLWTWLRFVRANGLLDPAEIGGR